MTERIRKQVDYLKEHFDFDLYNKYLNGTIKRHEMQKIMNCSDYLLNFVFKELNLEIKTNYIDNQTKHDFFDIIDSEEKAYILGLYLADGYCDSKNHRITFTQTEADIELINIVKNAICPTARLIYRKSRKFMGIYNKIINGKPMYSISIHSPHICKTLESYGMGNRKTYLCNTDLSFIPDEYMIHFIRGYFDGDGTTCIVRGTTTKNRKYENVTVRIVSYTKEHLLTIQTFLKLTYDITTTIHKVSRLDSKCNIISINKKTDFIKFRELLYKDAHYYLKRKKDKMLNIKFQIEPLKKSVKRINVITNEIIRYPSIKAAAIDFNVSNTSIQNWIRLNKIINNYRWEIIENSSDDSDNNASEA